MAQIKDLLVNGSARVIGTIYGNASSANKVNNKLTVGSKTYDGSAAVTIAASDLGLASAMLFLGTTTTTITDGATTNPIKIGGSNKTVTVGNVVLYGNKEFVGTGSAWEELGNEGSYKIVQSAVADPTASGTSNTFIATISQDTNGKITTTKKTVAVTNSAPILSGGKTSTIGTVASTNLQVKMPANPNTDTKVTQTVTTSNASYPLLLAPNGQTTTTTTTSYFDSDVTLNPSTNTIAANISGNAATATNLVSDCTGSWSNGTISGPTASLVLGEKTTSIGAIPAASSSISGIITTGTQSFSGEKTFNNDIFANGYYMSDCQPTPTQTNRFGNYQGGDQVQYTYRDASNNYIGQAFAIYVTDGHSLWNKDAYHDANILANQNNAFNIGSSSSKFANMYATTFHGTLDGNASTSSRATLLDEGDLRFSNETPSGYMANYYNSLKAEFKSTDSIGAISDGTGFQFVLTATRGNDYTGGRPIQLACDNYGIQFRSAASDTTGNNGKRLVPTDGTGASGTWDISVNGNAATATNADTVDGYHENSFFRYRDVTSTDQTGSLGTQIGSRSYHGALPDGLSGLYNGGQVLSFPGNGARLDIWCSHTSSSNGNLGYRSGGGDDKQPGRRLIDSANIGSQTVNRSDSSGGADAAGRSERLLINGATNEGIFNGNGQGGQPTGLGGSNDGVNMYVGNPSNFSVNYSNSSGGASSAGNADTVDGYHASDLGKFYGIGGQLAGDSNGAGRSITYTAPQNAGFTIEVNNGNPNIRIDGVTVGGDQGAGEGINRNYFYPLKAGQTIYVNNSYNYGRCFAAS